MSLDPARIHADVLAGLAENDFVERHATTRLGLPIAGLERLISAGRLTPQEVERLVLIRRALPQRAGTERLSLGESESLARVVKVITAAETTFGSVEKAAIWLRRQTSALENQTPLSLLETERGTVTVTELLSRIDHGLAV